MLLVETLCSLGEDPDAVPVSSSPPRTTSGLFHLGVEVSISSRGGGPVVSLTRHQGSQPGGDSLDLWGPEINFT